MQRTSLVGLGKFGSVWVHSFRIYRLILKYVKCLFIFSLQFTWEAMVILLADVSWSSENIRRNWQLRRSKAKIPSSVHPPTVEKLMWPLILLNNTLTPCQRKTEMLVRNLHYLQTVFFLFFRSIFSRTLLL